MKNKKAFASFIVSAVAIAWLAGCALTGCMTSKTNTVVTVNQSNLDLDASALQATTSIAVSLLVSKDPSLVPILKNAQIAVDGILNGANTNTTQQVLTSLKAQGNAALTSEITSLMGTVSTLEQNMLAKYGTTVAGQITVALTRAVDGGLIVGLGLTGK